MTQLHRVRRGSGRPLVILHGGGLDHRHMLDALEPVFTEADGWERIYLDLPGHGRSSGEGIYTQSDVLARVAETVEEIAPSAAVLGESRGSLIAHGLAMTRPDLVSGVGLIVPGGDTPDSVKPDPATLIAAPEVAAKLDPETRARYLRLVVQSTEIAEKIQRTKTPAAALADPETAARISESFDLDLPEATFENPTLIVAGRQDSIAGWRDAEKLSRNYPRATFAVLDTAGHSLAWERPSLFTALVRDWLDRMI